MWDGRAVSHWLDLLKCVSFLANRDSQVTQSIHEINGLVNTDAQSNELWSLGGCLHTHQWECCWQGARCHWQTFLQWLHGTSFYPHSAWGWQTPLNGHVSWGGFFDMPIDSIGPVELLVWQSREVRFFSTGPNSSMPHLEKVWDGVLHMFHVLSLEHPESRYDNERSGGINPAKEYWLLESTNEWLVVLDAFSVQFLG